ncbi:PQQ-dependent sugar dehydrogenase [Saccharothrix deserti]|uniref:PQQ-dependent sugar dehydrogenase n=1 Tax=Saccharothrix deserti TaxID=2593674 RepID=UPI001EE3EED0|nr:PQQ-dependent sugar dehydrogenase [Saccharothrix deserti]
MEPDPATPSTPRRRLAVGAVTVAAALSLLAIPGTAHGLADLQSESATISGGVVDSNHAGYTGSGFVNYDNATGGYVEYAVTAAQAGPHALVFRYANGTTIDRPLAVTVDGATAGTVSFPGTGAWSTWRDVTTTVTLKAGANRIRATATTENGGPNADRISVNPSGPADTEAPTPPRNLRSTGKSATSVSLAWDASTDNVGVTGYVVHRDGAQAGTADGTSTTVSGLTAGTAYRFTVRARDAAGNLSPSSNEITATPGGSAPPGVPNPGAVTTLRSGTDVPWGVAFLPDGSALVTEREAFNVYRLTPSGRRTNVGKVPGAQNTNGEGGVLGIEVSPTFATDGYVFVYHTASGGNQVVRAKLSGDGLSGWTTILGGIPKNRYHNGGRLRFSPDGRYLFVSTGDAQNSSNAQNMNNNAGKILRINPDGSIPSDNPFPGKAIWSYGHRNVQGLDFDSKGRLWASEFGNSSQDEVNLIQRGGNHGWPACEGTSGSCGGTVAPKRTWSTSSASPSGLTIINDHVFVATTVGQRIYRMRINDSSNLVEQQVYFQGSYGRLRTVEVDHDGDIWLTTSTDKDGTTGNDRVLHVDIAYPQP